MVDQASVNGRGTARVPGSSSAEFEGVAEFVDDLASLAELQARLAAVDFREAARKSAIPHRADHGGPGRDRGQRPGGPLRRRLAARLRTEDPPGLGDAPDGRSGDGPRGTGGGLGGMRLSHSFDSFRRSRKQLWLNLAWVRTVLVTSASARSHPRRRL